MSKEKRKNLSGRKDLAHDIRSMARDKGLKKNEKSIRSRAKELGIKDKNLESLVGRERGAAAGGTRALARTSKSRIVDGLKERGLRGGRYGRPSGGGEDVYGPVNRAAEHVIVKIPEEVAEAAVLPCPLGRLARDAGDDEDVYITAGVINAGAIHAMVGGKETTFTPKIDDVLYAVVELKAIVKDDAFVGSYEAIEDSADLEAKQGPVPEDHEWTASAPSGKAYRALGTWVDNGDGGPAWQSFGCGDVTFKLCVSTTDFAVAHSYRS